MELLPFDGCDKFHLTASVSRTGNEIEMLYRLGGALDQLVIPPNREVPSRGERLWQATCFHAFLSVGKTSYVELDFSPSGRWSGWRFTDYRRGMRDLDLAPPRIMASGDMLTARFEAPEGAASGAAFALAAVIEHRSGTRSYWALAHPSANRPDFHARDCFVARLP